MVRERKKTRGNELYQEMDYVKSVNSYQKYVKLLNMHIIMASLLSYRGLQAIQRFLDEVSGCVLIVASMFHCDSFQHSITFHIPPNLLEIQIRCLNNVAAAQLKVLGFDPLAVAHYKLYLCR